MDITMDEKIKRAKKWGLAHGYFGMAGGWIYHESGIGKRSKGPHYGSICRGSKTGNEPVCHGWARLYNRKRGRIEAWRERIADG